MAEVTATAATFLFTDIEGSTALLKRLRDGYGSVLDDHRRLLSTAFAAHNGQEVDNQGDAFFVAFPRARDAVLAAVAAQRELADHDWPEEVEVRVRIGIHTGEAALAENRYVGLSVHRAARICAIGSGGQILISQTTRQVLEDEEEPVRGVELRDLGEHMLKDLDRPVRLTEVVVAERRRQEHASDLPDEDRPAVEDERVALPGLLGLASPFPFVGRRAELAKLQDLLPLEDADRRRVALIGGEPGSGKSRLVHELATAAAARGMLVLYGSSDAVVNAPYKPFVEALDYLVGTLDPDILRRCIGTGGGELTRLFPDLSVRFGPFPPPVQADPDTERHRLNSALAGFLLQVSRRQPILAILDDVHWADPPTLYLIRHLARAAEIRMLLVATFREAEGEARADFADTLADVSRIESVNRLKLAPLDTDDVEEFVRRSAGAEQSADVSVVARSIGELTEGNPFFLCELWRTLVESGSIETTGHRVRLTHPLAQLSSPESVREVVQVRLSRLAPATISLLEVAALIGAEFDLRVVRPAAALDDDAFSSALEEGVRSGMIEEVPGPWLAHRFAHELVRRALADRLTSLRRAELNLRVGEALESVHAADLGRVLADLAHHFTAAASVGGAERAVRYSVQAAAAAMSSLAFEEAAGRLTTALELGIDDAAERARLELECGVALDRAGQLADARAAYRSAAALARANRDAVTMAHAALGNEEASNQPMVSDEETVALLREAVVMLGTGDSALHARLLSALSRALVAVGESEEAGAQRVDAIAMARRLDDPATLATVLSHEEVRDVRVPPEDMLGRLTEARDLALEFGDFHVLLHATWRRMAALVSLGDLHTARLDLVDFRRAAERGREPLFLHTAELCGSTLALCDGQLDEAEMMAERAEEWLRLVGVGVPASGEYGVQLFGIRREQGRLAELRPIVQVLAGSEHGDGAWKPGLVALLVELGMEAEARAELERLRADEFRGVGSGLSIASLLYLTDACSALRDAESASLLYPRLEPFAARAVQIGQLVACYGAADRYLGMLAGVLEDWDAAEAHFEYALYLNRRMCAATWSAHTAYEYARMLTFRGRSVDGPVASKLLAEAAAACERLGLRGLQRKVAALGSERSGPVELPDDLSAREVEVLRLVARGRSNREIGKDLFISEHTVANHMRSILRKTGCANRTDAAAYAYRRGLVVDD